PQHRTDDQFDPERGEVKILLDEEDGARDHPGVVTEEKAAECGNACGHVQKAAPARCRRCTDPRGHPCLPPVWQRLASRGYLQLARRTGARSSTPRQFRRLKAPARPWFRCPGGTEVAPMTCCRVTVRRLPKAFPIIAPPGVKGRGNRAPAFRRHGTAGGGRETARGPDS